MPAPTPTEQRRWRRRAAASITVHLDELDASTLDAIAIQLYYRYPHDAGGAVRPSRPEAIRALCAVWREQHGAPPRALRAQRRELAAFWRAETSWRQTGPDTHATAPTPPWSSAVRFRIARLVQLVLPW